MMLREYQGNLNGIFIDIYIVLRYPNYRLFCKLLEFYTISSFLTRNILAYIHQNCGRDSRICRLKEGTNFSFINMYEISDLHTVLRNKCFSKCMIFHL